MPTKSQSDSIALLQSTVEKLEAEALDTQTEAEAIKAKLNTTQTELTRARLELQQAEEQRQREEREKQISDDLKQARKVAEDLNAHVAGVINCWNQLREIQKRLPQVKTWPEFGEVYAFKQPVCLYHEGMDGITMTTLADVLIKSPREYQLQYPGIFQQLPQLEQC